MTENSLRQISSVQEGASDPLIAWVASRPVSVGPFLREVPRTQRIFPSLLIKFIFLDVYDISICFYPRLICLHEIGNLDPPVSLVDGPFLCRGGVGVSNRKSFQFRGPSIVSVNSCLSQFRRFQNFSLSRLKPEVKTVNRRIGTYLVRRRDVGSKCRLFSLLVIDGENRGSFPPPSLVFLK